MRITYVSIKRKKRIEDSTVGQATTVILLQQEPLCSEDLLQ